MSHELRSTSACLPTVPRQSYNWPKLRVLVLEEIPLDDITAIRSLRHVYIAGREAAL